MSKRYDHMRFTWWENLDLKKIQNSLSEQYEVEYKKIPWDDKRSLSLFKDLNDQLIIQADTLKGYLTPYSARLIQREAAPLTEKDQQLIEKVKKIYPKERPTPLHLR